uniref:Uncharacterized protein n=1 Tax=Anguilla anguilla TaxID=7936 RepID=A0A0E9VAP8_ANGAN
MRKSLTDFFPPERLICHPEAGEVGQTRHGLFKIIYNCLREIRRCFRGRDRTSRIKPKSSKPKVGHTT